MIEWPLGSGAARRSSHSKNYQLNKSVNTNNVLHHRVPIRETLNLKNRSGTLVVGEQTPYGQFRV